MLGTVGTRWNTQTFSFKQWNNKHAPHSSHYNKKHSVLKSVAFFMKLKGLCCERTGVTQRYFIKLHKNSAVKLCILHCLLNYLVVHLRESLLDLTAGIKIHKPWKHFVLSLPRREGEESFSQTWRIRLLVSRPTRLTLTQCLHFKNSLAPRSEGHPTARGIFPGVGVRRTKVCVSNRNLL